MKDSQSDRQTEANENGNGKPGKAAGDNGRFAVRALPIDYFNKYSCQWANVEPLENGSQSNLSAEQREKSIKIIKRKQRENDKARLPRRGRETQTKFHERICQKVKSAI